MPPNGSDENGYPPVSQNLPPNGFNINGNNGYNKSSYEVRNIPIEPISIESANDDSKILEVNFSLEYFMFL